LKPHREGHKIVTCAISEADDVSVAFPVTKGIHKSLGRVMSSDSIKKIIANAPFEKAWTEVILKVPFRGLSWDTVMVAHLKDNRKRIASAKFQAYVRYGIEDYSSSIQPYLESQEEGGNGFNRIEELPIDNVLTYNALDSLYERWTARDQREELGICNY
jgi:hypothetical protein